MWAHVREAAVYESTELDIVSKVQKAGKADSVSFRRHDGVHQIGRQLSWR
jgi:hypothetical protein